MQQRYTARGVFSVWIAFSILALIGVLGLACDVAYVHYVGQQLQNAADAGALAGAQYIHLATFDRARTQAKRVTGSNHASGDPVAVNENWDNTDNGAFDDVVIGRYYMRWPNGDPRREFVAGGAQPGANIVDAIKVLARRPDFDSHSAPLFWGPIFGTDYAMGYREAIAFSLPEEPDVQVTHPTEKGAVRLGGTATNLVVRRMHVESHHPEAFKTSGAPIINADVTTCSNYPLGEIPLGDNFSGNFLPNWPSLLDPLEGLGTFMKDFVTANLSSLPQQTVPDGNSIPLSPGYYPNGINIQNADVFLDGTTDGGAGKGVYIVGGDGFQITGNCRGEGVYIYVLKGPIDITGNSTMKLSSVPLTGEPADPPWAGVVIHMAAENPANTDQHAAKITGTEDTVLDGTLYLPKALLELGGTSDCIARKMIVWQLAVQGNGRLRVPPWPQSAGQLFLVE